MNPKIKFKSRLCGRVKNLLAVRTSVPLLCFVALALAFGGLARAEDRSAGIPFSAIGAKATADYQGDALGITATTEARACAADSRSSRATPQPRALAGIHRAGAAGKLRWLPPHQPRA